MAVHLKRHHVRIKLPVAIFLWAVEAEAPAHRVAPVVGCAGEEFVPGDRLHLRELEIQDLHHDRDVRAEERAHEAAEEREVRAQAPRAARECDREGRATATFGPVSVVSVVFEVICR